MLRSILTASIVMVSCAAGHTTSYTNDANVLDFTSIVSDYATFSNYLAWDGSVTGPLYTPNATSLAAGGRVYDGQSLPGLSSANGQNWILATFNSPVNSIIVIPNLDHLNPNIRDPAYGGYDAYQYNIYGSNNGKTWTELYDTISVNGNGPFMIGNFYGTAPINVNNTFTPGAGLGGTVGYEATFDFGSSYQYYAIGASTAALSFLNADAELSAIGAAIGVPGPTLGNGFPGLIIAISGLFFWYRKRFERPVVSV